MKTVEAMNALYHILTEGKHWPEDYVKTGINLVKASLLGQQSWYSDNFILQDIMTFADEFGPLSHKNSNLGFFSTIVKWFIAYSGTSKEKYQEFIERKLDGIIGTLQTILNDPSYDKIKDNIKTKWTFKQFEELLKKIADEAKASSDEKLKGLVKRDDYDLIPIYSYEELYEKYGGRLTGYKGESEWCHANGKSTYESWTKDGTLMFFVLARKGWKDIKVPALKPAKTDNAYDEYGLSLIAILVDIATGRLLNETLRWNHVIEPSAINPGASVDKAFKNNWGALSLAVGMDVKAACEKECKVLKQKLLKESDAANRQVEEILRGKTEIDKNTIPNNLRSKLTNIVIPNDIINIWSSTFYGCSRLKSVTIPDSVMSIGASAFSGCTSLTNVTIPNSVKSIEGWAFYGCSGLKSMMIPDSVTSIKSWTFYGCSGLTGITIGNGVKSIGEGAFWGCSGLTSMTIPGSVTSIGENAFYLYDCSVLTRLVFKGKTKDEVKKMENYPFGIKDESVIKCEANLKERTADKDKHFEIRFATNHGVGMTIWSGNAENIEDALSRCLDKLYDTIAYIDSVFIDDKDLGDAAVNALNSRYFHSTKNRRQNLREDIQNRRTAMKSYRRDDAKLHDYTIRYLTPNTFGGTNCLDLYLTDLTLDDIIPSLLVGKDKDDNAAEVISIEVDGKKLSKPEVEKWNGKLSREAIDECDGGGDAGGAAAGDASAAAIGDAGAANASAGDVAGEIAGTSTVDVLGKFEPGKGVMGPGNFMVPAVVKVPFHRWEIGNGGSVRKKGKNGKSKKTPYEKGMKVVVSMFEDEEDMPVEPIEDTKHDRAGMWEYWEEMSEEQDIDGYDFKPLMHIPELRAKLKTTTSDLDDAEFFDIREDNEEDEYTGFKKYFKTKQDAVQFALDRLHDAMLADEDSTRCYASDEEWEAGKEWKASEYEDAVDEIKAKGFGRLTDGRYPWWLCRIAKVQ